MKKILFTFGTLFLMSTAVFAQSTVDSIAAKYKLQPMPEPLTVEKTFPVIGTYQLESADATNTGMTTSTNATTSSNTNSSTTTTSTGTTTSGNLMITLDPANKGMIWIEGLPQGRIKAYLRKSPGTYRILAQTTESGKKVKEGVLHFEPTTNTLHIALGKTYDDADPTGVFGLTTTMDANTGWNTTATGSTGVNSDMNNTTTSSQTETKVKTADGTKMKTEVENDGTVKVKTKTPTSKTKEKITFYTATKVGMDNTTSNTQMQQSSQQQQ